MVSLRFLLASPDLLSLTQIEALRCVRRRPSIPRTVRNAPQNEKTDRLDGSERARRSVERRLEGTPVEAGWDAWELKEGWWGSKRPRMTKEDSSGDAEG